MTMRTIRLLPPPPPLPTIDAQLYIQRTVSYANVFTVVCTGILRHQDLNAEHSHDKRNDKIWLFSRFLADLLPNGPMLQFRPWYLYNALAQQWWRWRRATVLMARIHLCIKWWIVRRRLLTITNRCIEPILIWYFHAVWIPLHWLPYFAPSRRQYGEHSFSNSTIRNLTVRSVIICAPRITHFVIALFWPLQRTCSKVVSVRFHLCTITLIIIIIIIITKACARTALQEAFRRNGQNSNDGLFFQTGKQGNRRTVSTNFILFSFYLNLMLHLRFLTIDFRNWNRSLAIF